LIGGDWNRVLMKIIEAERERERNEQEDGKLHKEDLQNLYSSLNIIRTMKSRWVEWATHVAQM
jgi:hypothetical protein